MSAKSLLQQQPQQQQSCYRACGSRCAVARGTTQQNCRNWVALLPHSYFPYHSNASSWKFNGSIPWIYIAQLLECPPTEMN